MIPSSIFSGRGWNDSPTVLEISGGVRLPLGGSGGQMRIGPYYYREFYDGSKTGYDYFKSWGINWTVGLLF